MFTRKFRKVRKRKTRRGGLWPFKKKEPYKLTREPYTLTNEDFKDIAEEEIKELTHFSQISPNSNNTSKFISKFISYNPNDKKVYNEKLYRKKMRNALMRNEILKKRKALENKLVFKSSPDNYTKQLEAGREIIDRYLKERELEIDIIKQREEKDKTERRKRI